MDRITSSFALLLGILALLVAGTLSFAAQPWKFAVVCDTRGDDDNTPGKSCINEYILKKIAASIVEEGCDLVIVPGDIVNGFWANGNTPYETQFKNWKEAMRPVYKQKIPVYTVRGNHENGTGLTYPPSPPYGAVPNPVLKEAYLEAFGNDNPQNGPKEEKGFTYYFKHEKQLLNKSW